MSNLRQLDWKDILNWVLFSFTSAVLAGLLVWLQTWTFTIEELKAIGITGLIAWLTYLIKRFTSWETGTIGK
jgi:hypothetical protein